MGKSPQFQMAFLLFGQAGAGKSVLQSIVRGLLPPDLLRRYFAIRLARSLSAGRDVRQSG